MEVSILREVSENQVSEFLEEFAIDVLTGLSKTEKKLSTKYFYDDRGSDLFQKITQHGDYYLTRTEFEILLQSGSKLASLISHEEIDIIELGAGDGHKSELVIDAFLKEDRKVNYFPIDISVQALKQMQAHITHKSNLSVHGIVADYLEGLKFLKQKSKRRKLVLFLGSNIGNFDRAQSESFLRQLWKHLDNDDYLLIGFDLKKDVEKLHAAYNDSSGYTRDFNLNLLDRINRELGGNFNKEKFQHVGVFNPKLGAMESYLLPKEKQEVYIEELEHLFEFEAYEPLHLEYSFKYSKEDIERTCQHTGFKLKEHFIDKEELFIDSLWQVVKR
ncbi:L-histidine N(alpha)-methyltransferase [Halobacteriovorax sp. DA5]|uniref:L-histidine N(alpha)-methyltransferase n=1 Tax=Halobacteriovorax sp. DA5 TaxID=2067553 RepID=UPI000CD0ED92|nr:L-histidine N(alpha)-methyltransferase [Halobacteriovorax sp. DA5]